MQTRWNSAQNENNSIKSHVDKNETSSLEKDGL